MGRFEVSPVNRFAAGFRIGGVQVQAVAAGDQRQGLVQVRAEFNRGPGFAEVVAGDGHAAAQLRAGALETADIVALPAMEGEGDSGELLEGAVGVDAQGGVAFFGQGVGALDILGLTWHRAGLVDVGACYWWRTLRQARGGGLDNIAKE